MAKAVVPFPAEAPKRSRLGQAASALRHPDFRRLWFGLGVSQVGSQVSQVSVAYQLYQLTHSPLSLGLIGAFRFLPIVLAAVVAGPLADSRDRRRLMLATQSWLLLNSAVMAWCSWRGYVTPTLIYAFVACSGLGFAFDAPARQALVPNLVPRAELSNALSLNILVFQLATVAGPGLGGLLLRAGGPTLAYGLDAISFAALLWALGQLRYRPEAPSQRLTVSLSSFRDGLSFMARSPALLSLMLIDFVATFFAGSLLLLPVFADQLFHVGVGGLGLLYAAPAAGAVLAAMVMAGRAPVVHQGLVVIGSVIAYGVAVALFGLTRSFPLGCLFLAFSGAADTVSMVVRNTVRQAMTPDSLRGRMTGLNQLFFVGGPQLGEVEAGAVARLFGPQVSVVSGGVLCALAAGLSLAIRSLRQLNRVERPAST